MPVFTYLEQQGDVSPTSATFSNRAQSLSTTFLFNQPTETQLIQSIVDLLGFTDSRLSDGRIRRTLPARHPLYQWLFADSASPQGVGIEHAMQSPSPGGGSPIIPQYPLYTNYNYRVNFSSRPYAVWQDRDIEVVKDAVGVKKDGTTYEFDFATEWHRFCEWLHYPANQFIHAQQGQMVFRVDGAPGPAPNNFTFQDTPRLYLPDTVLKCRWYEVPYRYVESPFSYIRRFVGHVNQRIFNPFPIGGLNLTSPIYSAGQLLYLGATVLQVYNPPVPSPSAVQFSFAENQQRSRLCDLELNFLLTERKIGANAPTPSNANWIPAGWNLQPWLTDRKFYYATTFDPSNAADASKWRPMYQSFPFELFWTDPDHQGSTLALEP